MSDSKTPARPTVVQRRSSTASQLKKQRGLVLRTYHRVADIPWLPETFCWVMSFLFLVVDIALLAHFDGRENPELSGGLTLNTVVAFFVSAAKFCLEFVLVSGLGQSKWIWLAGRTTLKEFRHVDKASHGAWPSVKLLIRLKGSNLAKFGALIMVLSLGVGTAVQGLMTFPTEWREIGSASLPVADQFDQPGSTASVDLPHDTYYPRGMDPGLLSSVFSGIYSPLSTKFEVRPVCTSSNCTWPSFHTLGFTSSCTDLSSDVKVSSSTVRFEGKDVPISILSLPNGLRLQSRSVSISNTKDEFLYEPLLKVTQNTLAWDFPQFDLDSLPSIRYKNAPSVVMGVQALGSWADGDALRNANFTKHVAYECVIQLAVLEMQAQVSNGTLKESLVSSWVPPNVNITDLSFPTHQLELKSPTDHSTTYRVSGFAWHFLSLVLASLFNGGVYRRAYGDFSVESGTNEMQAIFNAMNQTDNGLPHLMHNLAESMTTGLRNLQYQQATATGMSFTQVTIIRVRWPLLAYPLGVLFLGAIFLGIVIYQSKKLNLEPWTDDFLPFLFHGPEVERQTPGRETFRRVLTLDEMKRYANTTEAQLKPNAEGEHHLAYTEREPDPDEMSEDGP